LDKNWKPDLKQWDWNLKLPWHKEASNLPMKINLRDYGYLPKEEKKVMGGKEYQKLIKKYKKNKLWPHIDKFIKEIIKRDKEYQEAYE